MDHSKIIRNIVVVSIISAITAILGYILRVYIARNYTVSEYGLFYSMVAFFTLLIAIADLGLFQAVIKKISELRKTGKIQQIRNTLLTYICIEMALSLIIGAILVFLSTWISQYFFHSGQSFLFVLMVLWFLTTPLTSFIGVYYFSYEKTTIWALFEFFKIFYILGLTLLLTKLDVGLTSIFISYATVYLISFMIFIFFNHNFFFGHRFVFDIRTIYPETFNYGLFVLANSLLFTVIIQSDTIILTYIRGLDSVGIYQSAIPLASILLLAVAPLSSVMLSSIASLWVRKKKDAVGEIVLLIQKYTIILFLPVVLTMTLYSDTIITLIFGSKFSGAAPILAIVSFSYMFLAISIVLVFILTAIGAARQVTRIMIIISILAILLNTLLILLKGSMGAAIAIFIINLSLLSTLIILINRKIFVKSPIIPWMKTGLASGVYLGVIYLTKNILIENIYLKSGICIAIAIIVYIGTLILLRVLSKREFLYFKKLFLR